MNFFKAEALKYRHTFLGPAAAGMALADILAAAVLTAQYFAMDSYNWWYMLLYPGTIVILCAMIGGKDRRQDNRTIYSLPVRQGRIWDAKIQVAMAASGLSMLVMLFGMIVTAAFLEWGLGYTFICPPTIGMQLVAAGVIWLTSLWQIPLCLWMSQKLGVFAMFLVHMILYSVFSIFLSLRSFFWVIPAGITPRLMCVVLKILPNGLPVADGSETFAPALMQGSAVFCGILSSLVWFALLWLLSRRSFERQVKKR